MQMDYEDKNFKSTWKNGILRIRIRTVADNTFNLMRIIFDAAVENDKFNLAIDARELQTLSDMVCGNFTKRTKVQDISVCWQDEFNRPSKVP